MLQVHQAVPHFTVTTLDERRVDYGEIWQRQNLLLVLLGDEDGAATYVDWLQDRLPELTAHSTAWVVTREQVPGAPRPGVVIADRWGEIHFIHEASSSAGLPPASELIEWLRFVQMQCPECQGEAR